MMFWILFELLQQQPRALPASSFGAEAGERWEECA
jgi:hypothetical protein